MRSVMIVDDENWIRKGLIGLIPWEPFGLALAGEVEDGEEAFAMAKELRPDIVFLDMRMPGWDGRQLLRELSAALPDALTIVVSGHSDFHYTKEAIRHKAFEYLLKPVKQDELTAVLEKALAELERRGGSKQAVEEAGAGSGGASGPAIGDWLQRRMFRAADDGGEAPVGWERPELLVCVGQPDAYAARGDGADARAALAEWLRQESAFLFGSQPYRWAVTGPADDEREAVVAFCGDRPGRAAVRRMLAAAGHMLERAGCGGYSFGVADAAEAPSDWRAAYRQAGKALKSKAVGAPREIVFAACGEDGKAPAPGGGAFAYPRDLEHAFLLALQAGNAAAAAVELDRFFAAVASGDASVETMQRGAVMLANAAEKLLSASDAGLEVTCGMSPLRFAEAIERRNDAESVRGLFTGTLIPAASALFSALNGKMGGDIVQDVVKLIESEYFKPLSLHKIAERRYLNPDYLGRLFKKTTGKTFVDYMTDYRIAKSKELLRTGRYKNYEIAVMVGYEDYRYFSQVFKKRIGMTIGEYRGRPALALKEGT